MDAIHFVIIFWIFMVIYRYNVTVQNTTIMFVKRRFFGYRAIGPGRNQLIPWLDTLVKDEKSGLPVSMSTTSKTIRGRTQVKTIDNIQFAIKYSLEFAISKLSMSEKHARDFATSDYSDIKQAIELYLKSKYSTKTLRSLPPNMTGKFDEKISLDRIWKGAPIDCLSLSIVKTRCMADLSSYQEATLLKGALDAMYKAVEHPSVVESHILEQESGLY